MSEHVNFLLLGLGNGAVYAALAMALVVTYRTSGVLNFATGAIALYGAYTYAFLRDGKLFNPIPPFGSKIDLGSELGFWPALAITLVMAGLLGIILYLAVFRQLRNATPTAQAVASLGVLAVFTALLGRQAGATQTLVGKIFPDHTYHLFGLNIVGARLWIAVTIGAVALSLGVLYHFTLFGLTTRAVSETQVGALVSGASPDRIAILNWMISGMVSALAAIMIAPLTPLLPSTYILFIVPALAAAVLGRMSALGPAVAGGLAIGLLQAEAVHLQAGDSLLSISGRRIIVPMSGTSELIPLILVLFVLVVRGKPLPVRGALLQQTSGRAPRPQRLVLPLIVGTSVGVIGLFALKGSIRGALIYSMIVGVLALSLVVVTGYAGQISLAQLTLAGVAGFSLSGMTRTWDVPFPIAPILAALVATIVGVVVGLPALRVRGLLLGVTTLTLAVALEAVWFRNNDFNGGSMGATTVPPKLFGIDLGIGSGVEFPRRSFGFLCLAVLVLVALGVARLRTSSLGSAMLAVRANERSAAAAGISVVRVKLAAFAISSFIAGIGGTLIAYQQSTITSQSFSALGGLDLFTTAYLAGISSVAGGVVAGLIVANGLMFTLINRSIDLGPWFTVISGIGVIFVVTRHPEGIVGPAHRQLERWRRDEPTDLGAPTQSVPLAAPTTSGPPLLVVENMTVSYGGVIAVNDLSFTVPEGAIVGLIGPNGAGKTTAVDALSGFVLARGRIELAGTRIDGRPPHQRARLGIGRTFQGVDLYEDLSIAENVVVGQHVVRTTLLERLTGRDSSEVDEVLAQLGLSERRNEAVRELSHGQKQLVSIARSMVSRPKLLVLDEPAGGLDSREGRWLADRLREVRALGTTILLIDHDMNLVLDLCDLVLVVDFGELIASGTPDEIRSDRLVIEAYLGVTHERSVTL